MVSDIWTIVCKELRELLLHGGPHGRASVLLTLAMFGIIQPLIFAQAWVEFSVGLLFFGLLPEIFVATVVCDSIAGERERHTLDTLLATRLPERAIVVGKMITVLAYGWGLSVVALIMAMLTLNAVAGRGRLLMFPIPHLLGALGIGLLLGAFTTGVGMLASMRARTVKAATQILAIATTLLFTAPLVGGFFLLMRTPGVISVWLTIFQSLGRAAVLIGFGTAIALLDIALIASAIMLFKRANLVVD